MSNNLFWLFITFCLFVLFFLLFLLKKEKISIKYSLVWFCLFGLMLVFLIVPNFLNYVNNLIGFKLVSNMIFSLFIVVLIFISLALTVIVSKQDKKIRLLVQEISLLKKKVYDK